MPNPFASRTARRPTLVLLAVLTLVAGCSGTGGSSAGDPALPQRPADSVEVDVVSVPGLGEVLADAQGFVLYMFPPDAGGRVTCTGPCAGTWPPLAIEAGTAPTAGEGVSRRLLGTLPDPNTGGDVVTYSGYPLYRYAGDLDPRVAHGQAMVLNGGPWYVLDPNGQPVTVDPRAAS